MCNTQTYYSGTKCLSLTHTCHTTHKGKMILPMGACPHRYYRRVRFVRGVNFGVLLCGASITFIESIKSIESLDSTESIES